MIRGQCLACFCDYGVSLLRICNCVLFNDFVKKFARFSEFLCGVEFGNGSNARFHRMSGF